MENVYSCAASICQNSGSQTCQPTFGLNTGRAARMQMLKAVCIVIVLCAVSMVATAATTFKALVSFDGTNGADPAYFDLVQGIDGELYGTTQFGGVNNNNSGTVFKINSAGTVTTSVMGSASFSRLTSDTTNWKTACPFSLLWALTSTHVGSAGEA